MSVIAWIGWSLLWLIVGGISIGAFWCVLIQPILDERAEDRHIREDCPACQGTPVVLLYREQALSKYGGGLCLEHWDRWLRIDMLEREVLDGIYIPKPDLYGRPRGLIEPGRSWH